MGGKHKQANRTKNNAKPASSGRSAELLPSKAPPLIGFSVLNPVVAGLKDDSSPAIDQDFQLVLKKMNKKDATTKLKALQEFSTLCCESKTEAVKVILPFWPRLYCALATDMEHRVREAAHAAHRSVVTSVGRNIAPYLKQLAGPWFTGQYDTYPPAASMASRAFQEAFPPNKVTEAIIFCQEEILNYICNNLQTLDAESLNKDKKHNAEETEAKYQRVIISSLHGYALYLAQLPAKHILDARQQNARLVECSKFWKYAKHETPLIRAAWFTALISLCQNAPFLLENEGKHLSTVVFASLDEAEPSVLPVVWNASLQTLVVVQDVWQHLSAEKLVFSKLWRILQEGGVGNASVIFPNILPLLSRIPPAVIGCKQTFYTKFFNKMRAGLKSRHVQTNSWEMDAVIVSLMECLRYFISTSFEDRELCICILTEQIYPLIESTMTDSSLSPGGCSSLLCELSRLMHYCSKQNNEIFKEMLALLWEKLNQVSVLPEETDLLSTTLNAQYCLLMALKNPVMRKQKKHLKVKFSVPDSSKCNNDETNDVNYSLINEECYEGLDEYHTKLRNKLLTMYLESSMKPHWRPMLVEQISKLVVSLDSKQIFDDVTKTSSWQALYSTTLAEWLSDDSVLVQHTLTIIFTLLKYVPDEDKINTLSDMTKNRENEILRWCVQQDINSFPIVKEWLLSKQLIDVLVSLALNATNNHYSYIILQKCLRVDEKKGLIISEEALTGILNTFITAFQSPESPSSYIECITSLTQSAVLVSNNYSYIIAQNSCVPALVISLFQGVFNYPGIELLNDAWRNGVALLAKTYGSKHPTFIQLTREICEIVVQLFKERTLTMSEAETYRALVIDFIDAVVSSEDDETEAMLSLLKLLLDRCTDLCRSLEPAVVRLCTKGNYVAGVQNMILTDVAPSGEDSSYIEKYFICSHFQIALLYSLCHESDESSLVLPRECLKEFISFISQFIYAFSLSEAFKQYFSKTKQYFISEEYILQSETYLQTLLEEKLEHETIRAITSTILHIAQNKSDRWFRTISIDIYKLPKISECLTEMLPEHISQLTKDCIEVYPHFTCKQLIEHCHRLLEESDDLVFLPNINSCLERVQHEINDDVSTIYNTVFDREVGRKDFSMENDVSNTQVLNATMQTLKFFELALKFYHKHMKTSHWDKCMVRLAACIQGIHDTVEKFSCDQVILIQWIRAVAATCRLMDSLSLQLVTSDNSDEAEKTRCTEWTDVFVPTLHNNLAHTWYRIAASPSAVTEPLLIECLSHTVRECVHYTFTKEDANVRDWLKNCCRLIISPVTVVQLTAYNVMLRLVPAMVAVDSEDCETQSEGLTCLCLKETLTDTQSFVDTVISELRFGDSCVIEPFTDSYTYVRGYLLLWSTLLELCAMSNSQLRSVYTAWLKEDYLPSLMKAVFCLMPESVVNDHGTATKRTHDLFTNIPDLDKGTWDSSKLAQVSCWVYVCALRRLPAAIRQWWNKSEHKTSHIVDCVTTTFVSPLLCSEEIKSIKQKEKKLDNMTIIVHSSVREVMAVYMVEEWSMELVIKLAHNHPLGLVKVNSVKCMLSAAQIKQWLLQLTIFLTQQNGTIWDGLVLWKNSLDKRFDGVEECYICFAILHFTTHQLPKISCHMCKKKFHSPCLYKWFTTSNKSTCPICRNMFH